MGITTALPITVMPKTTEPNWPVCVKSSRPWLLQHLLRMLMTLRIQSADDGVV